MLERRLNWVVMGGVMAPTVVRVFFRWQHWAGAWVFKWRESEMIDLLSQAS